MCRVPSSLRAIFADGAPPETLYTTEQAREALQAYAVAQKLDGPEKSSVVLDRLMVTPAEVQAGCWELLAIS